MQKQTNIISVFGQIPAVVADMMAREGKANRIEPYDIPATARYNDKGELAHCALVLSREAEAEFDRRVRDLRA